jgi:opacity protein-like surface antigen
MTRKALLILTVALGAVSASTRVLADDPLGFYVGAGFGEAHVRESKEILGDTGYDYSFSASHAAWKLTAGIRPLALLGAEVDYLDFGNPSTGPVGGFGGLSQVDAKAGALFAVGYLPIPLPFLDVYGKLGVARLRDKATEYPPTPACPTAQPECPVIGVHPFNVTDWSTDVAFGLGVQGKWKSLAIRAEYERIAANAGNPDLLSVGVTWTF